MRPNAEIVDPARSLGMATATADGMDVEAVEATVRELVDHARGGDGPGFVEARTYRFCGHMTGDQQSYRASDEVEEWRAKDSLLVLSRRLAEAGVDETELAAVRQRAADDVEAAVEVAWAAPEPDPDTILDNAPVWVELAR